MTIPESAEHDSAPGAVNLSCNRRCRAEFRVRPQEEGAEGLTAVRPSTEISARAYRFRGMKWNGLPGHESRAKCPCRFHSPRRNCRTLTLSPEQNHGQTHRRTLSLSPEQRCGQPTVGRSHCTPFRGRTTCSEKSWRNLLTVLTQCVKIRFDAMRYKR